MSPARASNRGATRGRWGRGVRIGVLLVLPLWVGMGGTSRAEPASPDDLPLLDTDPYAFTAGGWRMAVGARSDLYADTRPRAHDTALTLEAEWALAPQYAVGAEVVWLERGRDAGGGSAHGQGLGDTRVWLDALLWEEGIGPEVNGTLELGLPTGDDACGQGAGRLATGSGHPWLGAELELRKRLHPLTVIGIGRGQYNPGYDCAGRRVDPGHSGSLTGALALWINTRTTLLWSATAGYQAAATVDGRRVGDDSVWFSQGPGLVYGVDAHWDLIGDLRFSASDDLPGVGFGVQLEYHHD